MNTVFDSPQFWRIDENVTRWLQELCLEMCKQC